MRQNFTITISNSLFLVNLMTFFYYFKYFFYFKKVFVLVLQNSINEWNHTVFQDQLISILAFIYFFKIFILRSIKQFYICK